MVPRHHSPRVSLRNLLRRNCEPRSRPLLSSRLRRDPLDSHLRRRSPPSRRLRRSLKRLRRRIKPVPRSVRIRLLPRIKRKLISRLLRK